MGPCPPGTNTLTGGPLFTKPEDCGLCAAGYYCPSPLRPPVLCPAGTTSLAGAASCTLPCPAGSYCTGNSFPAQCGAGTYSLPGAKSMSDCLNCKAGYFCPPGSTSYYGSGPCSPGMYSNSGGSCTPCAPGYYTLVSGSARCFRCPKDHLCPTTSLPPTPCPLGTTAPSGSTAPSCTDNTAVSGLATLEVVDAVSFSPRFDFFGSEYKVTIPRWKNNVEIQFTGSQAIYTVLVQGNPVSSPAYVSINKAQLLHITVSVKNSADLAKIYTLHVYREDDVDVCNQGVCDDPSRATCTMLYNDRQAAYKCECKPGYSGSGAKGTCVDVDECTVTPTICGSSVPSPICTNTPGSFTCGCPSGYEYNNSGNTCDNINECTLGKCSTDASCLDSPGSYSCTCGIGFIQHPTKNGVGLNGCLKTGIPTCGNGNLEADESCDDGNINPGDGCSSECHLDSGATCTTAAFLCKEM